MYHLLSYQMLLLLDSFYNIFWRTPLWQLDLLSIISPSVDTSNLQESILLVSKYILVAVVPYE